MLGVGTPTTELLTRNVQKRVKVENLIVKIVYLQKKNNPITRLASRMLSEFQPSMDVSFKL